MITSTVNKHLLVQIRMMRGAYGTQKYKRYNKRVNFLLRMNQRHGRDHRLTMGEIDSSRINPLDLYSQAPRAHINRRDPRNSRTHRQWQKA